MSASSHHAAEDDLIWPKLHARAPVGDHDICRMEDEHRAIAAGIDTAKATGSEWVKTGAPSAAKRLRTAVDELIGLVDVHLDDEERDVVPLIEEYITAAEWKKATARGASILRTHPRLGLSSRVACSKGCPTKTSTASLPVSRRPQGSCGNWPAPVPMRVTAKAYSPAP